MSVFPRSSGVLLHPTSLPGRYGMGDLGEWAFRFVDWLVEHGQTIWQMLPLTPTGYADSPYQGLSAFAGNTNLISLENLVGDGWLTHADLADVPDFPVHEVDYGWVLHWREPRLALAFDRFQQRATAAQTAEFEAWQADNAEWLDDYALFAALKREHDLAPWVEWPESEALRHEKALAAARQRLKREIEEQRFRQWLFYRQWTTLKTYANEKGVRLFGDLPIFMAHDSADVWANRDDYYLDDKGHPTVIAGVPPDYFSPTGQRWGNPLYRWDKLKARGYAWWIARFKAMLTKVDLIRIDHFRGFSAYWEIPASEPTAIKGQWVPGPGADFFHALKAALGELPILAEDLGVITQDVEELRDSFDLPGMKVLQFAWAEPTNPFLPHNHVPNCIVYIGTHDNNTTVGWWHEEVDNDTRDFMQKYLEREVHEANWTLIRLGMQSPAHTFIATMQDVLGLGSSARMNVPGESSGWWTWRFTGDSLNHPGKDRLAHLTWLTARRPDQREREYGDPAVKKSK